MLENNIVNLKVIEKVALALEELNEDVIYVGGAVISLYITDLGAEQPRPTKDIDISVQISTYSEMNQLQEKLARKRFFPAFDEDVLYRYKYQGILIDFIPYEKTALGPTNSWLKPGFEKAYPVEIGSVSIKILPVSLYLCTKWEAFKSRGGDTRTSHDFEDIIFILDNNLEVIEDIKKAENNVKLFLKEMSIEILNNPYINEIIECHLNPYTADIRKNIVLDKLNQIVNIN